MTIHSPSSVFTTPSRFSLTVLACAGIAFSSSAASSAADASAGELLVTNKGDHSLSFIDPVANKQVAVIDEDGVTGHELITSPDGKRAYVPIYGNAGVGSPGTDGQLIRVIDVPNRKIVSTIDFGKGVRPHCPIFCEKTGRLYVTTELENAVAVIDPETLKIIGSVPTGKPESHMLAVSHDGKRGYTANVASGTVSVLDLEANTLITTIPVSKTIQRISVSIDDKWVFTSDQTKPQLVVIDTATNQVVHRIELPDFGYGTAPTPDGHSLLVCCGIGDLAVVDLDKKEVVKRIEMLRAPQAVIVRPDGAVAYVSCNASAKVEVVDLKEWKVTAQIDVGKNVDGLAWAAAGK